MAMEKESGEETSKRPPRRPPRHPHKTSPTPICPLFLPEKTVDNGAEEGYFSETSGS